MVYLFQCLMMIHALWFLLRPISNWIFKTDVPLQRWVPSLLPSIQRVKRGQKMHALQHGIQNKRHIVNTKGTISPLLLIYTVLHHSVVPLLWQYTQVVMHTLVVQETSQMRLQPKTRRHCAIPKSENSSDIPRQWEPVRPRTVSKPTSSSLSEPFTYLCFKITRRIRFSLFAIIIVRIFEKQLYH